MFRDKPLSISIGQPVGTSGQYFVMTNFDLVKLMMLNRSRAVILGRSFEISESIAEMGPTHKNLS